MIWFGYNIILLNLYSNLPMTIRSITIAVDSFKGSLTSAEVAEAFEQGFRRHYPTCEIRKVAIGDGGEGTVEALVATLGGELVNVMASDPLHRPIKAHYGILEGATAIIEMAAASGLTLLKPDERNPMLTSTYGTGELVADAIHRGCRNILVSIGGSATNDCGVGMLQALGFRFLDSEGKVLQGCGEALTQIATIDDSNALSELRECTFTVACDVDNPLYGERGAVNIFAPQKGATAEMIEVLECGVRNFARVVREFNGTEIGEMAGAGAAGGLGGGMVALLGAKMERGIDMVLNAIEFDKRIEGCDLVITGEGRLDYQTVMGKAPSGVLRVARAQGIPTIAIGGGVAWCDELRNSDFAKIYVVTPDDMPLEVAMQPEVAKENLRNTAERIAQQL